MAAEREKFFQSGVYHTPEEYEEFKRRTFSEWQAIYDHIINEK